MNVTGLSLNMLLRKAKHYLFIEEDNKILNKNFHSNDLYQEFHIL